MESKDNKIYNENKNRVWTILRVLAERPEGTMMKKDNYEGLKAWYKVALQKLQKKDIDFLNKLQLLWGSNKFKEIVDWFNILHPLKEKVLPMKKESKKESKK